MSSPLLSTAFLFAGTFLLLLRAMILSTRVVIALSTEPAE